MTELILIRHAPAQTDGLVTGRRDVPAVIPNLTAVRQAVGKVAQVRCSPALRCVQTAQALWPDHPAITDARLLEQDFGAWEGLAPDAVPDLGPLDRPALAAHRPPRGESFADICARAWPAFLLDGGPVALVLHAGTIRAALALALGTVPPALAFQIAPLSLTRLRRSADGWAIICVNHSP